MLNDVGLWRALTERDRVQCTDEQIAAAFDAVASRSVRRRIALLGLAATAAMTHPSALVRASAHRALIGARGTRAHAAIARGLDDEDSAVRRAAVEALRALASAEPERWIHAVVHSRADVRQIAVELGPPPRAEVFELPLLADEAARPKVLPRIERWAKASTSVPAFAVPALLDSTVRGWLPLSTARAIIDRVPTDRLGQWLFDQPGRGYLADPTEVSTSGADSTDPLDALLELEWSRDAPTKIPSDALWWKLIGPVADQFDQLRLRFAASAWTLAKRKGYWSASGLAACVLFAPQSLRGVEIPPDFVETIVAASVHANQASILLATRPSIERIDAIRAKRSALDRGDVLALAIAATMQPGSRFEVCLHALGRDRLVDAVVAFPRAAALLFVDPATSLGACIDVIDLARERSPEAVIELADTLLTLGGVEPFSVFDLVGPSASHAALKAHCARLAPTHRTIDPRIQLCRSIAGEALPTLLDAILSRSEVDPLLLRWLLAALETEPCDALAAYITQRAAPNTRAMRALLSAIESTHAAAVTLARAALSAIEERVARADPARQSADEAIEAPAAAVATAVAAPEVAPPDGQALDDLTYVSDEELEDLVKPFLRWPVTGVAAALELRESPSPNPWLCAALLRAHDAAEHVARVLATFWPTDPETLATLDELVASKLGAFDDLGMLASAWLFRWEKHARRFVELATQSGSLAQVLATVDRWPEPLAARAWSAAARVLETTAARGGSDAVSPELWTPIARLAIDEMSGDDVPLVRDEAARFLAAASRAPASRAIIEPLRAEATALRPSLSAERSALLGAWLDRVATERRPLAAEILARRQQLEKLRHGPKEAAAELVAELATSNDGRALILYALEQEPRPRAFDELNAEVARWRGALAAKVDEVLATRPVALAVDVELARAKAGDPDAWARAAKRLFECDELVDARTIHAVASDEAQRSELAFAWLDARSASVRHWAIEQALVYGDVAGIALSTPERAPIVIAKVEALLFDLGPSKDELRRRAARWLWLRGITTGFVLLAQHQINAPPGAPDWIATATDTQLESLVDAAMTAGNSVLPETWIVDLLRAPSIGLLVAVDAWSALLQWASTAPSRQAAINELNRVRLFRGARAAKLRAVARVFAWGVEVGLVLTGRAMSVQLARDQALGYTRLDEDRVFVSALPLLRGERFGRAVVEGLLLHEFGHHRYHRGDEQRAAWDQGFREGIGPLLNLVADEHLERNLRALDTEYGDRLKRLDSYAFQHMSRPLAVATLFEVLRGDLLSVLTSTELVFAQDPACVVLEHGRLLQALERSGSSFARWVRALRMGLGDRHGDEKVSRALALFSGTKFRKSTMGELLEIARKVRAIFGDECRLLNVVASHEDVGHGEEGELDRLGEGISDEEIRREVDRITNPRKSDDDGMSTSRPGGKRWLNVTEGTDFDLITQVVRVKYEPSKHRALSERVRRSAGTLRSYLERLGLHLQPQRLRLRGRRVDAPRTRALVTRGDPRVLIAREIQIKTDLFIGVVIDCSGSMAGGENMPRARLFGALIAEAARAMPGVDVRIFGFTDRVIYDAGDSTHPAVHALEAGGGNNDSGALWHAANVARASNRRAKLLVMISDGLPTECSAASLKHLAVELTRRHKMCCAQIAVQPLPEVLFPNYVECDGPDTDVVVKRFGRIIEGLVKRAMGVP